MLPETKTRLSAPSHSESSMVPRRRLFPVFLALTIASEPLAACGADMSDQSPRKNASLRLAEPVELAGEWRVAAPGRAPCAVRFDVTRVETANAHALGDPSGCLAALVGRPLAGWRPVPDGIELAGSDRLTVLLFSYTGDGGATATTPDGATLTLRRA
jgi:hypothetical protein